MTTPHDLATALRGATEALAFLKAELDAETEADLARWTETLEAWEDNAHERRDHTMIMLFAMRYAMGRQSAGVGVTVDYIFRHLGDLADHQRERMAREIDEAEAEMNEKIERHGVSVTMATPLGSPIVDAPKWLDLRDALREGE